MRKISAISVAVLTMPLFASDVIAQPAAESRWTVTPFLGASFGGDISDTTAAIGVASSYNFTPRLAAEGELGFSSEGADNDLFEFSSTLWTFSGNVIYHFTGDERVVPYATAGLGMLRSSIDIELGNTEVADSASNIFAFNLGGGVKAHLTRRAHIRGDIRFFDGDDVEDSFWRAYGGVTFMLGGR